MFPRQGYQHDRETTPCVLLHDSFSGVSTISEQIMRRESGESLNLQLIEDTKVKAKVKGANGNTECIEVRKDITIIFGGWSVVNLVFGRSILSGKRVALLEILGSGWLKNVVPLFEITQGGTFLR